MSKTLLTAFVLTALICYSHQLPGGWQKVSPSDTRVKRAASFAVEKVSEAMNSKCALKLIRAESAYFQIVAGINYKMDVFAGLTSCLKGGHYQLSECQFNLSKTGNAAVKCGVTVYLDLQGKHHLSSSSCRDMTLEAALGQAAHAPANSGRWEPATDGNKEVQDAAVFGVEAISEYLDAGFRLKLARVGSAQKQVVAGMNYKMTVYTAFTNCRKGSTTDLSQCGWSIDLKNKALKCEIKVYKNLKQQYSLTYKSCELTTLEEALKESAANGVMSMPGGWSPVIQGSKDLQEAAEYGVKILSEGIDSMYKLKLARVSSGQEQVVAGMNYKMTVFAAFTNCQKGIKSELSQCEWNDQLKNGALKCDIQVYRNLQRQYSLTSRDCKTTNLEDALQESSSNGVAPVSGGWIKMSSDDKTAQKMAEIAVAKLSSETKSIYRHKLVKVVFAEYQVVEGINYLLIIEFGLTDCLKTSEVISPCNLKDKKKVLKCTVEVLAVPWQSKYTVGLPKTCQFVSVAN